LVAKEDSRLRMARENLGGGPVSFKREHRSACEMAGWCAVGTTSRAILGDRLSPIEIVSPH